MQGGQDRGCALPGSFDGGGVGQAADGRCQVLACPPRRGVDGVLPAVKRGGICRAQDFDDPAGMHRPDALVQPEHPEPGEVVGGVGDNPGGRQEVLDVSCLGEP